MARRNRRRNENKNMITNKKDIMKKAHEMCRQMRQQGFEFDYHAQLSLNMKYLYEIMKTGEEIVEIAEIAEIAETESKYETNMTKLMRIEKVNINAHMSDKEIHNAKNTRHGIISINNKEYYFSANRYSNMPIVFGADSLSMHFELVKALDNKMIECGSNQKFFILPTNEEHIMNDKSIYTDKISEGILIIKDNNKYFGYMGNRAVCYRKGHDNYPSSCAIETLIKDLDRPGKMSFRSMKGAGKRIETELMPQFLEIVTILEERNKEAKTVNRRHKRRRHTTTAAETPSESPVKTPEVKTTSPNNNTRRRRRRLNNEGEVIDSDNTIIDKPKNSKKYFQMRVNNFSDSQYIQYVYGLQKRYAKDSSLSQIITDAISDDLLTPEEFKDMLDSFDRDELTSMIRDNKVIDEIYKSNPEVAQEILSDIRG